MGNDQEKGHNGKVGHGTAHLVFNLNNLLFYLNCLWGAVLKGWGGWRGDTLPHYRLARKDERAGDDKTRVAL